MREVKKVDLNSIQDRKAVSFGKTDPGVPEQGPKQEPKKTDLSKNPSETLGRSMVNDADNLKNDVKFGMANPQAIANADKFFDKAYANLNAQKDPYAYEKASAMTKAYVEEFCS